jgi:hypothetical protein
LTPLRPCPEFATVSYRRSNQAVHGVHQDFRVSPEERVSACGESERGVIRSGIDAEDELAVRSCL